VFGDLESSSEELEPNYRSHGSLHESQVPLIIYNSAVGLPTPESFQANLDITRIPFGL
jgi:phosphonoacetate hydrolase